MGWRLTLAAMVGTILGLEALEALAAIAASRKPNFSFKHQAHSSEQSQGIIHVQAWANFTLIRVFIPTPARLAVAQISVVSPSTKLRLLMMVFNKAFGTQGCILQKQNPGPKLWNPGLGPLCTKSLLTTSLFLGLRLWERGSGELEVGSMRNQSLLHCSFVFWVLLQLFIS